MPHRTSIIVIGLTLGALFPFEVSAQSPAERLSQQGKSKRETSPPSIDGPWILNGTRLRIEGDSNALTVREIKCPENVILPDGSKQVLRPSSTAEYTTVSRDGESAVFSSNEKVASAMNIGIGTVASEYEIKSAFSLRPEDASRLMGERTVTYGGRHGSGNTKTSSIALRRVFGTKPDPSSPFLGDWVFDGFEVEVARGRDGRYAVVESTERPDVCFITNTSRTQSQPHRARYTDAALTGSKLTFQLTLQGSPVTVGAGYELCPARTSTQLFRLDQAAPSEYCGASASEDKRVARAVLTRVSK